MEPILVPPGQPGPNYIAEGFFPDCGLDDYLSVIVQLDTGSRHVATFHKVGFSFTSPNVPTTFVTVVCWFYFPNEEPNTEHGWFVKHYQRFGYVLGASPGGSPCCFSGHNPSCWTSKRVETKQDAIDQAYLHWVAAGRPKPQTYDSHLKSK